MNFNLISIEEALAMATASCRSYNYTYTVKKFFADPEHAESFVNKNKKLFVSAIDKEIFVYKNKHGFYSILFSYKRKRANPMFIEYYYSNSAYFGFEKIQEKLKKIKDRVRYSEKQKKEAEGKIRDLQKIFATASKQKTAVPRYFKHYYDDMVREMKDDLTDLKTDLQAETGDIIMANREIKALNKLLDDAKKS